MALQSCPLGLPSGAEAGQIIRQGLNTIDTMRVDSSHCALWDFENVDNFIVSMLYVCYRKQYSLLKCLNIHMSLLNSFLR